MDKIINDIKKKVLSYTLPEGLDVIPPYNLIKTSKEELYRNYSNAVVTYNRICDTLAKLQYSQVTVDRLLKELANSSEVFSKQKLYSSELRNLKEEIKGVVESYRYLKDGLESTVRFYNSVQFLLNSYRLEEV